MIPRRIKYLELASSLRGKIVQGEYGRGARLPNRQDMVDEFGVSMATVQKALDILMADGFVKSRAKAGTFVADHPPHLCEYGLVLPAEGQWSRFCLTLLKAAELVSEGAPVRVHGYFSSKDVTARAGVNHLCKDVCAHKVGGLFIHALSLKDLEGTPAMNQIGVPRVLIDMHSQKGLPAVSVDYFGSFVPRAVKYLRSVGCRRIAHVYVPPDGDTTFPERVKATVKELGGDTRSYWMVGVTTSGIRQTTRQVVELLMQLEGEKRPDGLVIHDDNLVDGAAAGIMAAGVRVPDELKVVAHCNRPRMAEGALPVKWLGFDCCELLRTCLRVVSAIQDGRKPPPVTDLPARFDDEL